MKNKNNLPKDAFVLSQLRQMEIIDISEGKRLGFIGDLIFDDNFTKIDSFVIPLQNNFISMFKKKDEIIIKWEQIKVIGIDIILVDTSIEHTKIDDDDNERYQIL